MDTFSKAMKKAAAKCPGPVTPSAADGASLNFAMKVSMANHSIGGL